jgi:hypothetical protein
MSLDGLPEMIISAVPGVGAAILSIYNYFKARKGAEIAISHIYQFGSINLYDDGKDFKVLFLSLPFENQGTAVGAINSVKLVITWDNNRTVLYPVRRVELTKPENDSVLHQEDFAEQLPILPVYVSAYSGTTYTFEFHDVGENPFPRTEEVNAKIIVTYKNGKKRVEKDFVMQISERSWNRSESYDLAISYDIIPPKDDPEFNTTRLWGSVKDSI